MKIGEITISDSISLIFFIYEFWLHVTFFITSIVVFVRIITKWIQRFIDILKMMQLISIFLWLFGRSIAGLLVLIWPEVYDHLAVLIINNINDLIFFHYWLNQLSWYVLVQHLLSYRQIANGMSYEDWRVKVKHKEKVGIIVVVAIYIVLIIFVTILPYNLNIFNLAYINIILR